MSLPKPRIGVIPIGEIPEIISKSVAAHFLGYLNLDADILSPLEHPTYALDHQRLQYNAGMILKSLESGPFQDYAKVIGLLDVDLFIPIFTHVFGEAQQGGKSALISLYRLKNNPNGTAPPESILLERAAKVALHEAGHLFNLFHCMDERCLMHFSGNPKDLDAVPLQFCRYCATYLKDALHHP